MSRTRLFLYQANYGLAAQDLVAAQAILAGVDPSDGGISPEVHAAATDRLAMTISSLPDRPVLAADGLDIAWQMLVADPGNPASNPPIPVSPPADPAPAADAQDTEAAPGADSGADTEGSAGTDGS